MLSDHRCLALRLEGPLQSWGFDSQYNRRNTGLLPTKSAIAGMCCAALGHHRGSEKESIFLEDFASLKMTAVAIPREVLGWRGNTALKVRRLQDYQTVQNTRRANGPLNTDCVLTHRQYLTDASFGVLLKGPRKLLESIAAALGDPVWGIWLGRKTCIPSAPVLAGLAPTKNEALALLVGDKPIEDFFRQEDVENFADGKDSLPDSAVSFALDRRLFSPRRIMNHPGK